MEGIRQTPCANGATEKKLAEKLGTFEVDWRFNPPAASHMGGVWKRMVRSVKNWRQCSLK